VTGSATLNALIFAALGLAVFFAACGLAVKVAAFDVWRQVTDGNIAAAIVAGAAMLAMGWIIAAAMH
jgi:hypothetical protein